MRDRLIELIESARYWGANTSEEIADHLLAEGVIVLPCKVGDKVYMMDGVEKTIEFVVTDVFQDMDENWVIRYKIQTDNPYSIPVKHECNFDEIGKFVFLTRELAEEALAERREKWKAIKCPFCESFHLRYPISDLKCRCGAEYHREADVWTLYDKKDNRNKRGKR